MSDTISRGFTRRNFIKGAALLTATGALAGCAPQQPGMEEATTEAAKDEIYAGVCRGNCGGGCFLNVHVRDGQVVRTTARDMPDTQYNRICTKGLTHVGRMYGANRILYPMKRVGERSEGKFERISWDEALDIIAEKWKGYIDEYGPESMAVFYGSGNYALASGSCNGLSGYQRFANVVGSSIITLNVDAAVGFGQQRASGGIQLWNELTDRKNAKTMVCWGSNPTVSLPQTMHFFLEAKEKGAKYIVIDPVYNANAAKADWWIPIKAGTDGALALGMLNHMFTQGWISDDVLKQRTNSPFLIKEDGMYLRMSDLGVEPTEREPDPLTGESTKVDPPAVWDANSNEAVPYAECADPALYGVPAVEGFTVQTVYENAMEQISQYPVETAAEICGLSTEDVVELARVYCEDGPVATEMMMGTNHYRNGHYGAWPIALVALLTGNTGIKGGGLGCTEEYLVQALSCNSVEGLTPTDSSGNPCQGMGRTVLVNEVGNVLDTGKYAGDDMTLKGVYVHCSNPVVTMANHDYTTNWFDNMEFVVVADMCMTETAKRADIVLPSAHWFEVSDALFMFATHPYILWQDKAVEPQGEAKSDFQIFGELCNRLGYGDFWQLDDEGFIKTMMDSDAWRALGITFDQFKADKAARIHTELDYVSSTEVMGTETGRIGLYQEVVPYQYDIGQEVDESIEKVLYWEEPVFAGEHSEARKAHPYHLLSEHMRTRTHTQWWDCDYVKDYEPEPIVRLNPDDAAELGIVEGDVVKVFNDQGFVVMKAAINAGLPRKMVSSARSFQSDEFIEGHYASLPSEKFNQICANQAFNDVAVSIEKM